MSKIKVHMNVSLNDLKLIKELAKHGDKNGRPSLKVINFLIEPRRTIVWATDSYKLGSIVFNRSTIEYTDENWMVSETRDTNDELIYQARVYDKFYGSVSIDEFNKHVAWIIKTYSKEVIDRNTHLEFSGNSQVIDTHYKQPGLYGHEDGQTLTADRLKIVIDNTPTHVGVGMDLNQVKGSFTMMESFKDIINSDLDMQPITEHEMNPKLIEDVSKFMAYNTHDKNFTRTRVGMLDSGFGKNAWVFRTDSRLYNDHSSMRTSLVMPLRTS